jgi:hypothetical protein
MNGLCCAFNNDHLSAQGSVCWLATKSVAVATPFILSAERKATRRDVCSYTHLNDRPKQQSAGSLADPLGDIYVVRVYCPIDWWFDPDSHWLHWVNWLAKTRHGRITVSRPDYTGPVTKTFLKKLKKIISFICDVRHFLLRGFPPPTTLGHKWGK